MGVLDHEGHFFGKCHREVDLHAAAMEVQTMKSGKKGSLHLSKVPRPKPNFGGGPRENWEKDEGFPRGGGATVLRRGRRDTINRKWNWADKERGGDSGGRGGF